MLNDKFFGDNPTLWRIILQDGLFYPKTTRARAISGTNNNRILFLYPVLFIGKSEREG
jgi:hypothetical protein